LSRKTLQPNPWETINKRYKVGDLVEGVVTTVREFGVFIELGAGIEGLLHSSEIPTESDYRSQYSIKPGEEILLRITAIQAAQQRISLSIQQVTLEEQLSWMMHKNYLPALDVTTTDADFDPSHQDQEYN
jgi:ribosomal protein S1